MAPPRVGWENLSDDRRKKLIRNGVTRTKYEQGKKIPAKANGHKPPAKTATRRPSGSATTRATGRTTTNKRAPRIGPYGAPRRTVKQWDQLKPATRQRLTAAGITRQSYADGIDTRRAYGKPIGNPAPSGFPTQSRDRVAAGQSNADDRRNVIAWRQSASYPSWLPRDPADMDDQTAAILSTIRPYPNATDRAGRRAGWRNVQFQYNPNKTVTMTVTPIHGRPFTVLLPDSDSARQTLSALRAVNTPGLGVEVNFDDIDSPNKMKKVPGPKKPQTPSVKKPAKKTPAANKAPAKKAPAAKKAQAAKAPKTVQATKQPAPAKKAPQQAKQKANTRKKPVSRTVSTRPRKAAAPQPLGVFDLLASTIDEAINIAGEAIETAQDTLGL